MRSPLLLLPLLTLLLALTLALASDPVPEGPLDCSAARSGFYCKGPKEYYWCYSEDSEAPLMSCNEGTVCECAYTSTNPCAFPGLPPSDCEPLSKKTPTTVPTSVPTSVPNKVPTSVVPIPIPIPTGSSTSTGGSGRCPSPTGNPPKKFVGYYTNWAQYREGNCKFLPENIPSVFTHIMYAFGKINGQSFALEPYEWNDESTPYSTGMYDQVLKLKNRQPHLKVLLSVGGWNFNDKPETRQIFSQMVSSQNNRASFINSAISFLRSHGLDGIDIDWEYPAEAERGGTPQDTPNYSLFLEQFRAAIDNEMVPNNKEKLLLTIATPAGISRLPQYEFNKIHQYVDWINIMTYDLHGSWELNTGLHTSLYCNDGLCVDAAVNAYLDTGIPKDKLLVGMATYGRSWTLQSSQDNGIGAPATQGGPAGSCTQEAGFMAYYEIMDLIAGGATVVANKNGCYAYKDNLWVSYDDTKSITEKTSYINTKGLGGGFVWAIDLDAPLGQFNTLQCTIANALYGDQTQRIQQEFKSDASVHLQHVGMLVLVVLVMMLGWGL